MKNAFFLMLLISLLSTNSYAADVLLYVGAGATSGSIASLKKQIINLGLSYTTANSAQINAMTRQQFATYKLIAWPGGNSITAGNSLTKATTTNIHNAVVYDGVSYIGFCAGAFMAAKSSRYNTFNLASTGFGFYKQGAIETVSLTFPSGSPMDVVYWDGPELRGFGEALADYPDGDAAIAQGFLGPNSGFVVLTAVHPEAPPTWSVAGYTVEKAAIANAYARVLITAAINKTPLPHF